MNESEEQLIRSNKEKRKNASLTTSEWLTFFFLPFFSPKSSGEIDDFSESELERFRKYEFENKYRQAIKLKLYGYLFWTGVIFTVIILLR